MNDGTGPLHRLLYRGSTFDKDGIGTVVVCSLRFTGRIFHATFYPALDPPLRYELPIDRIKAIIDARSAAEAVRICHEQGR